MPDILSSDELNELLAAVDDSDKSISLQPETHNKNVVPYDFRRPTRLSRTQMRQLQRMHESALEGLTGVLSENLRAPIEANVLGVKALTYRAFLNVLSNPIYANIFRIEPFDLRGILTLDVPFCLAMVDRLLGGHGHITEKPRILTPVEMTVLDWPVKLILEQLQNCWHTNTDIKFVSETKRMDLNYAQILHNTATVLRVSFALGGEMGTGEASFCVPFAALEQAMSLDKLHEEMLGIVKPSSKDLERAKKNIQQVTVCVTAELGRAKLTVAEILKLKPGQVVKLGTPADSSVTLNVGQAPKFLAQPGLKSKKYAVQIIDTVP